MARFGPFEPAPVLAVAVSGGADSMALALLADRWARARDGHIVALTVDHGLRAGSAAEARTVGRWLAARGIRHRVLRWIGDKPVANVQAAARAARYGLLGGWCRDAGILHLLLAHHRDDQAETFLLRLGRGSGLHGLAAMPGVAETDAVRLLRPLLGTDRATLRAFLAAAGQDWIEDPANRQERFARTRVRAALAHLAAAGITELRIADAAAELGRARAALDRVLADCLAVAVAIDPAGWCRLDPRPLVEAPAEIGLRALARVIQVVGGEAYAPREVRLARLAAEIAAGGPARARTLGGCLIRARGDDLLVVREPGRFAPRRPVAVGREVHWDGRFRLRFAPGWSRRPDATVGALGSDGWAALDTRPPVPREAALSLPAVWQGERLLVVPHFRAIVNGSDALPPVEVAFSPPIALAGAAFSVV